MHGSIVNQVHRVFDCIKAFGQSKHEAKQEAREHIEQNTWHNVGKQLEVYSYKTADNYRDIWKDALSYAKENYKIRDIEKLTGEYIKAFLEAKIADGVKYGTFQVYAAALEKLEVALNRYSQINNRNNAYNFSMAIAEIRQEAKETLEKTNPTRAYEDPKALIEAIKNDTYKTIAQAQYRGGFRISEINNITARNLLGNNTYLVTNSKGGLRREVELPKKVYEDLKTLVANTGGKFVFDPIKYRETLKQAAIDSNQAYTGSHGLRWSYAQKKYREFRGNGYGYEQTLLAVSKLLGHHRGDITKHYLKI